MKKDVNCIVAIAKLQSGPKTVELDGAISAVVAAAVLTLIAETSGHFGMVTVVAICCVRS